MKIDELLELVEGLATKRKDTLKKKANDYATDTDVLSAFKLTALISKLSVNKVFLIMCCIKMIRLAELTHGDKEAKNEPVDDTFQDLVNYIYLWYAWRYEKGKEKK